LDLEPDLGLDLSFLSADEDVDGFDAMLRLLATLRILSAKLGRRRSGFRLETALVSRELEEGIVLCLGVRRYLSWVLRANHATWNENGSVGE